MGKLGVLFIAVLAFVSASCATLLKGRTDEITVISEPAGAKVSVNGEEKGTTPVTFTVPSKEDLNVHVVKDGYRAEDINDPATTRWGYEAFSFLEWVVPVFVDMGTGAAWGHDQLSLTTHLEPSSQPSPAAVPTVSAEVAPSAGASPVANASPAATLPSLAPSPIVEVSPAAQPSPSSAAVASPASNPVTAAKMSSAVQ
ncbi:MAG TPA: PEGA domain-containing protein [Candidatus Acidoferrum sp.]|nr:PEGA domain-containing protein [Candidatus Acidoferrum sp.]